MSEHQLPEGWAFSAIQNLTSADGLISDGDWVESKDQDPNGSIRLIQLADIGDGDFRNKSNRFMSEEKATLLNCTFLAEGDVLVARMPDPLGRACLFPGVGQPAVTVVDVCLIRVGSSSALTNQLLKYWINSPSFRGLISENASGTTRKRITRKKLEKFEVPVPPLAEQKVIADKLDTLLAQMENTKARLERIPQILKRFRQSVLAAAVSGRLTEEWREQNGVSDTDWDALTVGDVATVATGKTPSRKEPKYWEDGDTPWLTSASTGAIYTDSAEQFVTKSAVDECSLKVFPPGTLLLAMYGEGKTRGQVTELRLSATCNQACAAVTADEQKILRSYLKLRLLENYEETRKAAAGGAQPNLNLNKVRTIGISVPDKEEQTEIVRRVDQLFAHADRIEQQVNNALARVNSLTQSILAKAFRGELTEQWRKENPELISGENSAEALLERIRSERAAQKPTRRRTKIGKTEQAAK